MVLYGEDGRNGKDTLEQAISNALGQASGAIAKDILLDMGRQKTAGSATPHLCDLHGKRIAWANEPEKGARFNVSQVKDLSGGGEIPVRPLYAKDYYKIKPTHLLVLLTNHKPHADASDSAFWDRLRLITFNMRFVDNPQDTNERSKDAKLWDTLEREAAGILAWLVRGCLEWQRSGLATPAQVLDAGKAYREEEDNIALWMSERCTTANPKDRTKAKELYTDYAEWCKAGNMKAFNSMNFGLLLAKRFQKAKTNQGIIYIGIRLLPLDDDTPPDDSTEDDTPLDESVYLENEYAQPINEPVEPGERAQASNDSVYRAYLQQESVNHSSRGASQEVLYDKGMHSIHFSDRESGTNEPVEPDERECIPKEKVYTNPENKLPQWLKIGTPEWNNQVKRTSLSEMMERRKAAIEQIEQEQEGK